MPHYIDRYVDPYGDSESPPVDTFPVTFNKFLYTRRTTDADPGEYRRNLRGNLLMRHYGAQPEGVNVYLMSNGTITENDPSDWDLVDDVLWGGHDTEISTELAVRLFEAGYGEWITNFSGYIDIYEDIYL